MDTSLSADVASASETFRHPLESLARRGGVELTRLIAHEGLIGLFRQKDFEVLVSDGIQTITIENHAMIDLACYYAALKIISKGIGHFYSGHHLGMREPASPNKYRDVHDVVEFITKTTGHYWECLADQHPLDGDPYVFRKPEVTTLMHRQTIDDYLKSLAKPPTTYLFRDVWDRIHCSSIFQATVADHTGHIPILENEATIVGPIVARVCSMLRDLIDRYVENLHVSFDLTIEMLTILGCQKRGGQKLDQLQETLQTLFHDFVVGSTTDGPEDAIYVTKALRRSPRFLMQNFSRHPLLKLAVNLPTARLRRGIFWSLKGGKPFTSHEVANMIVGLRYD